MQEKDDDKETDPEESDQDIKASWTKLPEKPSQSFLEKAKDMSSALDNSLDDLDKRIVERKRKAYISKTGAEKILGSVSEKTREKIYKVLEKRFKGKI